MTDLRKIERQLPWMYIRFYAVGLLLFLIPYTRPLFVSITTASLVLVFVSVFWFCRDRRSGQIALAVFIVVSSFFLEYYGIATGAVFGHYSYGRGLAPLVAGTPLIIGLNWLFLIYASHLIAGRITPNPVIKIMAGALLMVVYDMAVEWAAPPMQMWSFTTGYPPLRNFIVWFTAALVYHSGFEVFRLRHDNRPARILFGIQIAFFIVIGIISTYAG